MLLSKLLLSYEPPVADAGAALLLACGLAIEIQTRSAVQDPHSAREQLISSLSVIPGALAARDDEGNTPLHITSMVCPLHLSLQKYFCRLPSEM